MPTARLFTRTATGRASLLAIVTTATIIFTSLAPTQTVFACPAPPLPLRALYMNSDLIVVARLGETTPVEMVSSGEENSYKRYLMRTSLNVSSTVKGQGNYGVVNVYHWAWQQRDIPYSHVFNQYSDGDKLLFFLNPREDGQGYEIADNSYGVKSLPEADLRIYLQRIDELSLIMQQEKPDPAQIVEWLVRCAEEPATRWEGLQELTMSNYALRQSENKDEPAEAEATTEAEEAAGSGAGENAAEAESSAVENSGEPAVETKIEEFVNLPVIRRNYYLEPDPNFMRLLTESQKSRLANILFNAKTITYDEASLIDLVKRWNEPRLVPFVMSQLRSFIDDPPSVAEDLMGFMAETLKDEELTSLASKYSEDSCYNDEVDVSGEEAEGETEDAAKAGEETQKETEAEARSHATEEPVVGNCTQKRSAKLKRFIAHVESVMAR
jgi:hypothetical protein